tara:strand:+ start:482 stop:1015 length:534 start_codon:yes stop_codon:yes gene_type:complete
MSACNGQSKESSDTLKIKDFDFKSWFGYKKNTKTDHNHSLLGTGFFRTPRADNIDTLISTWIEEHPNAIVIPVYTFGPTMTADPNSKQTYCWVVDNSDTLNLFLVKNGAVPGGTMQRPKTWKEMSRKEKEFYDDRPDEEVHVSDHEYDEYIEKVKIADEFARENKLGIYEDQETENE